MAKNKRKPHRIRSKKSFWKNRFFGLGILAASLIASAFYFLFLSDVFQVKQITVSGQEKSSEEAVRSAAEKNVETEIFSFRTKNIFLADLEQMEENILAGFPEIAGLKISRRLPDSISILVSERVGLAVWCQNGSCFLLDAEGIIFEETSGGGELIAIEEKTGEGHFEPGECAVAKEKLEQILKIANELAALKISAERVLVSAAGRADFETPEGWQVYFDLEKNVEEQLLKLRAVLEEKRISQERETLQYIDLRFEKVYYK